MALPALSRPLPLSRRHLLWGALAFGVSGCGLRQEMEAHGKAFTDPQIPPGLPPEHYPPRGFVWSGLKAGKLPEARYGVASPPVNPKGHFLILADAAYPAEVYFDIGRIAHAENMSVWIFEAAGQGGSGRYMFENQQVDTPDFRRAVNGAGVLISDIIRPETHKPLSVFGHGSGALTAMLLEKHPVQKLYLHDVWRGPDKAETDSWSGDSVPEDDWGRIAHRWQRANPDLRLKGVTPRWLSETEKARKAVQGRKLSFPADWLEAESAIARSRSICERSQSCQIITIADRNALKSRLASQLAARLE